MRMVSSILSALCFFGVAGLHAQSQDLKIGTARTSTSADPHFFLMNANDELRHYAFESLVDVDESGDPKPRLAASWKLLDDKTWEFKLRDGVTFHDGRKFTAKDVIYSICRVRANVSAGSFARYVSQVAGANATDPLTLVIRTRAPYPLLLPEFSLWAIVPAPEDVGDLDIAVDGCGVKSFPTNADFDNLKFAIGTGSYAYTAYTVGGAAKFKRFDRYWGERPAWETVTIAPIEDASVRTAAFLAGDYQLIQGPTPSALTRIEQDAKYKTANAPTYDVRYLMFDTAREPSPQVTGTNGRNPFKDRRVREAVSKALNRPAIIERVLNGKGVAIANIQGPETFGFNHALKAVEFDIEGARKLMASAGYAEGFGVTLSVQLDTEASRVGQAVAQMLARIGIKVQLDSLPTSVFFQRRSTGDYSLYSYTVGARTGEMGTSLRVLLGTPKTHPGFGNINGGGYSNPDLDRLLVAAQAEMDDGKRRALLEDANRVMAEDHALALIYQRVDTWAFNSTIAYQPSISGYTLARDARLARRDR